MQALHSEYLSVPKLVFCPSQTHPLEKSLCHWNSTTGFGVTEGYEFVLRTVGLSWGWTELFSFHLAYETPPPPTLPRALDECSHFCNLKDSLGIPQHETTSDPVLMLSFAPWIVNIIPKLWFLFSNLCSWDPQIFGRNASDQFRRSQSIETVAFS